VPGSKLFICAWLKTAELCLAPLIPTKSRQSANQISSAHIS
jgi:hypothetical protein